MTSPTNGHDPYRGDRPSWLSTRLLLAAIILTLVDSVLLLVVLVLILVGVIR